LKSTEKLDEGVTIMNKSKAVKVAIAFKRGLAFVRGMRQLAQDADVPDGARWITVGAHENEDGESSGGRHVLIDKESGTILKGLSKDVQGKTLKEAFKELKKDQKGEKNDQTFRSMPRKEFIDMFKSTGGDELSENNTLKIWYKDHTFKHFDYESDRKELARALRQPGIKAIAWSNEGDVGYYGSPNDIVMRNVNTNETKPLAEVQKDAGVGSLWVVDDVIDSTEKKAAEQKAAEQKAAEQKAAEQKAAEQKAAEQKATEQKAAEDYPYYEYGKRYRYDDLPSGFWDKWKTDKQTIKDAGFQPIKIDGEWKLKTFEGANHKALDSLEAKNSANEKQKAEPMNTDNLPDKIFNSGEVPVIDQVDYKGINDNYDYAKLKERRSKLNADIGKEAARLEKEGQKTSSELTKMQYELKGVEGQIKKYPFYKDKKYEQDRFFGKDNYKFGDYGRIRHVIDRDTVILNIATDALRLTRNGDLQLNVAHDTAVYLKGFNVMPMRILTGNSWENIYAVKFNRKFYNPKPLDRSFDNAAFEKAPTFDDLVRVAKDQDLNYRYPQKVITPK
jgi:hypothetical protein